MFKHRLLNLFCAVALAVAVIVVVSAHQAGATKSISSHTSIATQVSPPASSILKTKRVGNEIYYRLPGGNWVR